MSPLPGRRLLRRTMPGLGVLLGLLALAPAAPAGAAAAGPRTCFSDFVAGWEARSTTRVVGCMDPKGKALFRLAAYPLSGRARIMGPEQAGETLKTYFKRVGKPSLKDVTPEKSPACVRLFEYRYKATGENACTTHLQVKLKQDRKRGWVLASVTESARPRK